MKSVNPATGVLIREYTPHSSREINSRIETAHAAFLHWKQTSFAQRTAPMKRAAQLLRERKSALADLMADEMGKILKDGEGEIEKCAACCDYYAEHAERMLQEETIPSDARRSFVTFQPIGAVLAIMPWNFPFWQVIRFAAPNLMAGNVGLLKHASNVSGCALALEKLLRDAGFPEGCFTALLAPGDGVERIIEHPLIRAVTLTGSTEAGRKVAAKAGSLIKKTVLELGGSDAYVVLADADIPAAATLCAKSRLINGGQSCIAAKRFIVVESMREAFEKHFVDYFKTIRVGPPKDANTTLGPLARADLRDSLHDQVRRSLKAGAKLSLGGSAPEGAGAYYLPTVLSDVKPGMPAFDEELFGPVAAIVSARDEEDAFRLANLSPYGLGSAIFTTDAARAEELARTRIDAGQTFINSLVASDPRLPFGGVKESGYGRELSSFGIREFVNIKTVSVG